MITLQSFGSGQGHLKGGFLGFPKSGKSYTALLLAMELRRRLNLSGPIAFLDTESGCEYLYPMLCKAGIEMIGYKSRAFVDLLDVGRQCEAGAAPILIVDSITHVWRELCAAYFQQLNEARDLAHKPRRTRLEFQDWSVIKERWNAWTDFYLNSQLHIIICGRAGFEWDFQERDDGGKDLVKTGVKMKVESEFGFEPSLLVEMERMQVPDERRPDRFRLVHRATVIGDRFDAMDGAMTDNPSGEWFAPHLDMLTPGAVNVVDTELKTPMGIDERGNTEWQRERRQRTQLCEEIEGEIVKVYPGQTAEMKRAKIILLEKCFDTTSWTKIEGMNSKDLAIGLEKVRKALEEVKT